MQIRTKQAFISYDSQISALMAKKALNKYCIEELDVRFLLDFVEEKSWKEKEESMQSEVVEIPPPGMEPHHNSSSMMFMKTSSKVIEVL